MSFPGHLSVHVQWLSKHRTGWQQDSGAEAAFLQIPGVTYYFWHCHRLPVWSRLRHYLVQRWLGCKHPHVVWVEEGEQTAAR